ncbi:MAG TPA: O-antigen ligase family protein [Longimicrobiales bacterium]|nr:O-antigen ligase family protein [Longimicrobiales bacterium]
MTDLDVLTAWGIRPVGPLPEPPRLQAAPPRPTRAPLAARPATQVPVLWLAYQAAVIVMLLTYVWRFQQLYGWLAKFHPVELSTGLAALLLLATGGVARLRSILGTPVFLGALFLLVQMVLSIPGGVYPGLSLSFLLRDHIKTFMLLLFVALAVRSPADARRLALAHVVGALAYSRAVLAHAPAVADVRLQTLIYYDANDYAMLLVCTLPFAFYFIAPPRRLRVRLLAAGVVGYFIYGIIRSGSRGGFLGVLTVLAALLASSAIPWRQRLVGVVGVLGLLNVLAGAGYWTNMKTLLHPSEDYNWAGNSQSGRMEVWKRGIGYMLDRPVLGVGANAFFVAEGKFSPLARQHIASRGFKWSAPHNSFVQVGAELGLIGLFGFIALLVVAARAARRLGGRPWDWLREHPREAAFGQTILISLAGYVVCGFFLTQAYSAFMHTIYGMLIGLTACARAPQLAVAAPRRWRALEFHPAAPRPYPHPAWQPGPGVEAVR